MNKGKHIGNGCFSERSLQFSFPPIDPIESHPKPMSAGACIVVSGSAPLACFRRKQNGSLFEGLSRERVAVVSPTNALSANPRSSLALTLTVRTL